MLEKLFRALQESARPTIENVSDRPYSTVGLHAVKDPVPDSFMIHTLAGINDYLTANLDALKVHEIMLHVLGPSRVELVSSLMETFQQRKCFLEATFDQEIFTFGRWIDHEEFIIALHSMFEETEDRQKILQLVGSFTESASRDIVDDGVTQQTTVKAGARVKTEVVLNPVTLKPFRSFSEIDQPESKFVFRLRPSRGEQPPQCGLFEADGGAWKLVAIERIAAWLREKLSYITIIA